MTIESYFTQQVDVRNIILKHLDLATKKVIVAVAWFTDTTLFNKLIELQEKGVLVEVIITKHEFNDNCSNDYSLIEKNGGFFSAIGSDSQLMHMKFCVIDYNTVISGSANWSNRAFTENNEEVTIVQNIPQRTNDFIYEFDRLKELTGRMAELNEAINLAKTIKYFKLIKAFIDLGDTSNIQPYIYELKQFKPLENITNLLLQGNYDLALDAMNQFEKDNMQLIDITTIEIEQLKSQIKLLSFHIESLEIEKIEIEAVIERFNHRYIIELNPLIAKVLALKKKIYKKLEKYGYTNEDFEEIEEEFNRTNKEYELEKDIHIQELSDKEIQSIKEMYREGVKYCHPDSPQCIFEDKIKSAQIFSELSNAYKLNDLERVQQILNDLRQGNPTNTENNQNELNHLSAKHETLKQKYAIIMRELSDMISSKEYQHIINIENWDDYFNNQRELLELEYQTLTDKHVNHEQ